MAEDGAAQPAVVNEIATLLDQCSPEELANILQAIEGADGLDGMGLDSAEPMAVITATAPTAADAIAAGTCRSCNNTGTDFMGNPCTCEVAQQTSQQAGPLSPAPVPPAAPPPSNGSGRRPAPAGFKRSWSGGEAAAEDPLSPVSMGEMKKLLEEHSAGVLNEVRNIVSAYPISTVPATTPNIESNELEVGLQTGALNLEVLTAILAERDDEVHGLEARLAELQDILSTKDRRVMDLNGELDCAIREVRHRQLDLEFQQLKLEERVRSNTELEQSQRSLTDRVEEANRTTRHAELDVELGRSPPRSARGVQAVQGSLPWMLRKNRPYGADAWGSP